MTDFKPGQMVQYEFPALSTIHTIQQIEGDYAYLKEKGGREIKPPRKVRLANLILISDTEFKAGDRVKHTWYGEETFVIERLYNDTACSIRNVKDNAMTVALISNLRPENSLKPLSAEELF